MPGVILECPYTPLTDAEMEFFMNRYHQRDNSQADILRLLQDREYYKAKFEVYERHQNKIQQWRNT